MKLVILVAAFALSCLVFGVLGGWQLGKQSADRWYATHDIGIWIADGETWKVRHFNPTGCVIGGVIRLAVGCAHPLPVIVEGASK